MQAIEGLQRWWQSESIRENDPSPLSKIEEIQISVVEEFKKMKEKINSPFDPDFKENVTRIFSLLNNIPNEEVADLVQKEKMYKTVDKILNVIHWAATGVWSLSAGAKVYYYGLNSEEDTVTNNWLDYVLFGASGAITVVNSLNKMFKVSKNIKDLESDLKEIRTKQIMTSSFQELKDQIAKLNQASLPNSETEMKKFLCTLEKHSKEEEQERAKLEQKIPDQNIVERRIAKKTRSQLGLTLPEYLMVASSLQPQSELNEKVTNLSLSSKAIKKTNSTPNVFKAEESTPSQTHYSEKDEKNKLVEYHEKTKQELNKLVGFQVRALPIPSLKKKTAYILD